jgi:hypothetical protein
MARISDEQIEAGVRALAAMLPAGSMPAGFVIGVNYLDADGEMAVSTFSHGLSVVERIGFARALSLEAENLWELPFCPWSRDEDD